MEIRAYTASYKRRKMYMIAFIILFIVLVPVIIPLATGYRLAKVAEMGAGIGNAGKGFLGFSVVRTGALNISHIPEGAEVYVNYKLVKKSPLHTPYSFFVQNITPGNYLIAVAKTGYWSWAKRVTVEEMKVTDISVLLVPQVAKKELVTATSSPSLSSVLEEWNASEQSLVADPSSHTTEIVRGRMTLWYEDQTVYAAWQGNKEFAPAFFCDAFECVTKKPVYTVQKPIHAIDFYPERNDAILIQTDEGLYAVELDSRGEQNSQLIYGGANGNVGNTSKSDFTFYTSTTDALYIQEAGNLYRLII